MSELTTLDKLKNSNSYSIQDKKIDLANVQEINVTVSKKMKKKPDIIAMKEAGIDPDDESSAKIFKEVETNEVDIETDLGVGDDLFKLDTVASKQFLGDVLGIPTQYYAEKCSDKSRFVQFDDMLEKATAKKRDIILRQMRGTPNVIAIGSERYGACDHPDIIDYLIEHLGYDHQVIVNQLKHRMMNIIVPFDEVNEDDYSGNIGLNILNSETKEHKLEFSTGMWRSECDNSWILSYFSSSLKHTTNIMEQVGPYIMAAINEHKSVRDINNWMFNNINSAKRYNLSSKMATHMLKGFRELPVREIKEMTQRYDWKDEMNLWDLSNVVTNQAHDASDINRPGLEKVGGNILELGI